VSDFLAHERLRGLYVMDEGLLDEVYGPGERRQIEEYLEISEGCQDASALRAHPELLEGVEVLVSSWGCPRLDAELLSAAPKLRAVFYAAGSVQRIVTAESWAREIVISSAKGAIATRVAEFTASLITLSLKHFFRYERDIRSLRAWVQQRSEAPGTVHSVVGLVALGSVGRLVAQRLVGSDLTVLGYDPLADEEQAQKVECTLVGLEELFANSDVVSLHAPLLPETRGLVDVNKLRSMKLGATLINTARGGLIDQEGMIDVLKSRPDLTAVLDVTEPEPPEAGSELFELANVVMTPHIAGPVFRERRTLGVAMMDEVRRYVRGERLQFAVRKDSLAHAA
jgi:phosphoglycerate dehydrogenase-like enzyme